ncbi:Methionine synthase [Syntrophobotulus glycolicus DSM 8271]|uniref:Methionine synthase n=1 Tax=Syntrophobotulus glycolicus (strain DSM 8271 / FlGlyR) TaxID=645991 RepID=F0SW37_SYNGF|nr:corrinoid protein [Syntrophobotulus glycolicus]ADY56821.1 Methionine synthase [Syntrophobotulus glycolicus DSM 8271]
MAIAKEELFQKLSDAVVDMDEDISRDTANQVINEGYDPFEAIDKGLSDGMRRAGDLFEEEEYFIPELMLCADAMDAGIQVLSPHIEREDGQNLKKVVIAVVQGDTHDIGKNLVRIMLDAGGYEVIDLGRDIPPRIIVDKAKEAGAQIIALSTLMTTTMPHMEEVITLLKEEGIRDHFKVIIGGGPISQRFADKIGADGYSTNASDALKLLNRLFDSSHKGA